MPSITLLDSESNLRIDDLELTPGQLGMPHDPAWSIVKQTLRGGRRDGVDLIRVDNGALKFSVCPTRGMGLWDASFRGDRVGWRSPVIDGPVNPAFVALEARGGLGFLQGFDELMTRCGLDHNGPPYREGEVLYPLHGRIANLPAHRVTAHVDEATGALEVEGEVDESELFFPQLRLRSSYRTTPGSNAVTVRDEITNRHEAPGEFQLLYHWNLGPPHLEEGSRFLAPARVICPKTKRAAEGLDGFDTFGPPEPGFAEQVYLFELHADDDGRTVVLLRNRSGNQGVSLRFSVAQLPAFILWKSTQGLREGYVTGLEPAVNYPNPKPFEKARGRVVPLEAGATYVAETTLEVHDHRDAIAQIEAEIRRLQARGRPTIHPGPVEPYVAPE